VTAAALRHAVTEARRFLAAAEELERSEKERCRWSDHESRFTAFYGPLTARVKRASMDLTKALPPLRRPS